MERLVIRGQEHEVETDLDQGKGTITVDGAAHEVEVLGVYPDRLLLSVDGQTTTLFVAAAEQGAWIGVGGEARLVSRPARARRGGGGAGEGDRLVTPTFPAAVVKVLVEPGQAVARGDAVVVVSAMKMEMTLTAPHGGTVTAVRCAEGDQVKPGDNLVEIEEDEDGS